MGTSSWNREAYASVSATRTNMSRKEIFKKSAIREDFDPKNINIRESRDSDAHPNSNAIIVGLDVTGSMGMVAEKIAKEGLGKLVEGILDRRPVSDPHIMMMAIGDIFSDRAPLQATQFETDICISEQLVDLWLEGGGGGNSFESYDLPWAFAARKTDIDCFNKRKQKGYLFTMGDEHPPEAATQKQLNEAIGLSGQSDPTAAALLAEAQEKYNVFHLIVEQGSYYRYSGARVRESWNRLLGKRAIHLDDYNYVSEVIISVIEVNEGKDPQEVIDSWQDLGARKSVTHALFGGTKQ